MPKAAFITLGCKVNQYETQKILESFSEKGFDVVPFESAADVYVINTCSVTSEAERKSRYTVRRALRHNESAKVVVTGCAAQMSLNQGEPFADADLVVPNPDKLKTWEYFSSQFPELVPEVKSVAAPSVLGRTRATLKVQDGCDVLCSYCSIPFTRPKMTSRPWREVVTEAHLLYQQGYREAILTGVLIGSYGPETGSEGPSFDELIQILANETEMPRYRISSIEMHQVTDAVIEQVKAGRVVPHFHIPLQAGSSRVLKDMNRRYDQKMYIDLCHQLQKEIPGLTLTTDILVGFPTETEAEFQESVKVCKEVGYLSAHVFSFSPRWGTPADQWGDPVSPQEKASRRNTLMQVTKETGQNHMKRFLGQTLRVLVESKPAKSGMLTGFSDNYLSVQFAGATQLCRTLQWVKILAVEDGYVLGELSPEPSPNQVFLRTL